MAGLLDFACDSTPCPGNTCCPGTKWYWPELMGADSQVAKATIQRENPFVTVFFVLPGMEVIQDFCCNRVWLYVTSVMNGTVVQVPKCG